MADKILERALAKRDAALREAAEWETFIQRYRQLAEKPLEDSAHPAAQQSRSRPVDRELPPDSELAKTITITEAILKERGRPMPLDALFNEVTTRGLNIGGRKPKDNYGARLYNSGRFLSISKKIGWWFKDRPLPDVLDEPSQSTETPNSGTLFGAPKTNGASPLSP
jgi:hypothetical protein